MLTVPSTRVWKLWSRLGGEGVLPAPLHTPTLIDSVMVSGKPLQSSLILQKKEIMYIHLILVKEL